MKILKHKCDEEIKFGEKWWYVSTPQNIVFYENIQAQSSPTIQFVNYPNQQTYQSSSSWYTFGEDGTIRRVD